MKYLVIVTLFSLLAGCSSMKDITVKMPLLEVKKDNILALVKVNDQRPPGVAASRRKTALNLPMGDITFDPPEVQLVKNLLEVQLTKILREKGIQSPQNFVCDIKEFGVNTKNATLFYWDVVGRIRLILTQGRKKYQLSEQRMERTYVWPSKAFIKRVTEETLEAITANLWQTFQVRESTIGAYHPMSKHK